MKIKGLQDEDFINYKKPSMIIAFPNCTFKCGKELCQNSSLATFKSLDVSIDKIIERYKGNDITSAIVCAGLDPMDSFDDLIMFVKKVRDSKIKDEIVVYTGYNREEIAKKISILSEYENIIVKFGRFIPNQETHFDEVLGVYLASDNQYAKRIS